jgi:hypothetical protein
MTSFLVHAYFTIKISSLTARMSHYHIMATPSLILGKVEDFMCRCVVLGTELGVA